MKTRIRLLKTVQNSLSGMIGVAQARIRTNEIKNGIAIAERIINICQRLKSILLCLIRASPTARLNTAKTIALTASLMLSVFS